MKKLLFVLLGLSVTNVFADTYKEYSYVSKVDNLRIIKHGFEDDDQLFLGKKLLKVPVASNLSIIGKYTSEGYTTYLLWTGAGGNYDDTTMHLFFVNVGANNNITISKITHEGTVTTGSGFINVKFHNKAPYSDSDDFGNYTYTPKSNTIKMIKEVKADSYYKKKFASYTATKILQIMKNDGCDPDIYDGEMRFDRASCGYGVEYCFMFNSIKKEENSDYALLDRSCHNY